MEEKTEVIDDLKEYREQLANLTEEEKKQRDLYLKRIGPRPDISKYTSDELAELERKTLRNIADGRSIQGPTTEYASIDKPWLYNYTDEAIMTDIPKKTAFKFMHDRRKEVNCKNSFEYIYKEINDDTFNEKIKEAQGKFESLGIKKGDVVTLCLATAPEAGYAFYALNRMGAIVNPIDVRTPAEGMKDYIVDANSKYVVAIDMCNEQLEELSKTVDLNKIVIVSPVQSLPLVKKISKFGNLFKNKKQIKNEKFVRWEDIKAVEISNFDEDPNYEPNAVAVIAHTSGTTSKPKSILLTNENLNAMAIQYINSGGGFNPGETFMNIVPINYPYGLVNCLHMPLCVGLKVVLIPKPVGEEFGELLMKYKPEHILAIPMHYLTLEDCKKKMNLSFLKSAGCGGDAMTVEQQIKINQILKNLGATGEVLKGYGMSEVSSAASAAMKDWVEIGKEGIPLLKTTISAFDPETHVEKRLGEAGEIAISGPTIMKGYHNNPEETNKVLRTLSDGNDYVFSGDLGSLSDLGQVEIDGRIKRQIITKGFKLSPLAIENAILKNENVQLCSVVGKEDKLAGHLPVAFIVLTEQAKATLNNDKITSEINKICLDNGIPEYALPTEYNFVEELPLTELGKINYRKLTDICNGKIDEKDNLNEEQVRQR